MREDDMDVSLPSQPQATVSGSVVMLGDRIARAGYVVAVAGVVLPLLLIGILKFTLYEIEALKPLITNTPWLAWLYPLFGFAGASYFLGVVELITAALFIASFWSSRAGIAAGALGVVTFTLTVSTMLALPIWETSEGGFPFLNGAGSFLIKDVALLGVSLLVLGDAIRRPAVR
jgi:reactive chlorine resistance protein C